MLKRIVVAGAVAALASGAGAYPLKQVSRLSTFSSQGYDTYPPLFDPSTTSEWDFTDSTTAFGTWSPNRTREKVFSGPFTTVADEYRASMWIGLISYGFMGNTRAYFVRPAGGHSYTFDVVVPLRVLLRGSGGSLTGPSGFSFTFNLSGANSVEKDLAVGRYTMSMPVSSSANSNADLVVLSCPNDFTGDNLVDDSDFVQFVRAYDIGDCGSSSMGWKCLADLNGDREVDDSDFVLFAAAYDRLACQ